MEPIISEGLIDVVIGTVCIGQRERATRSIIRKGSERSKFGWVRKTHSL